METKLSSNVQDEQYTCIWLTTKQDIEPKNKIKIVKKPKKVEEEKEPSPLKDQDIELPNLRHSNGETQAPLVSNQRIQGQGEKRD